ncbi:MAG: hypothetical protein IH621_03135 [Krumholzibacteria bacterium]|nr:hypothetical protein [Candidatus Krumholzibacteria bacterium]
MKLLTVDQNEIATRRVNEAIEKRIGQLRLDLKALKEELSNRGLQLDSGVAYQEFARLAGTTLDDLIWGAWMALRDFLGEVDLIAPTGLARDVHEFLRPQTDQLERVALGVVYENLHTLKEGNPKYRNELDLALKKAIGDRKRQVWNRVCTDSRLLEERLRKEQQVDDRRERRADRRALTTAIWTVVATVVLTTLAGLLFRPRGEPAGVARPESIQQVEVLPDTTSADTVVRAPLDTATVDTTR